jgi:hypothetical protein
MKMRQTKNEKEKLCSGICGFSMFTNFIDEYEHN